MSFDEDNYVGSRVLFLQPYKPFSSLFYAIDLEIEQCMSLERIVVNLKFSVLTLAFPLFSFFRPSESSQFY